MSKYSSEPQFAETQALVAVMNDDEEEIERLLDGMTDSELMALRSHARILAEECSDIYKDRARGHRERPAL